MYYFIVNTQARNGNAMHIWNEVKIVLKRESIQYKAFETSFEGHATEITRMLCQLDEAKVRIIILGGDGTINEVINGITDFDKVCLGIVPMGTGNDFARNLGIKGSIEELVHDILQCEKGKKLDVGQVRWGDGSKKRRFAISSGMGFDALVCKYAMTSRVKKILNAVKLGRLAYLILTVKSLFTIKTYNAKYSFASHSKSNFKKVIFSAAMNLRAEGGGVPMAPSADATDGLFSMCIAADIPTLKLPYYLTLLVLGKHEQLKCFHVINDTSCHITTNVPVVLHADGEYLGDVKEVWYECFPQKLEVLNTIK